MRRHVDKITGHFSPIVPPFAATISRVVEDMEAPGGQKWERLNAGESYGKLPLRIAQDAVYQSHTSRLTGLWFLPNRPKGWIPIIIIIIIIIKKSVLWQGKQPNHILLK